MKTSKPKTIIGYVLLTLILVSLVVVFAVKVNAGNLVCDDLTGCTGKLNCGGPGDPSGCEIDCDSGGHIDCPDPD